MNERSLTLGGGNVQWTFTRVNREAGRLANRSSGKWGSLNHYDYGFSIYNPGIAKFLSVDPLRREYPWYTPYQFAGNTPIQAIVIDGLEPGKVNGGGTLDCPDCAASLDVNSDWITVTASKLPKGTARVTNNGRSNDPISRAIWNRIRAGDTNFSINGQLSSSGLGGYSPYTEGVKDIAYNLIMPVLVGPHLGFLGRGGLINFSAQFGIHCGK